MNKLIHNYPCRVLDIVDGRTFDGLLDLGFNLQQKLRIQMAGVELPDTKSKDPEVKADLDRAKNCLRLALMGGGDYPKGRRVIVAPTKPNRYNRSYFRVYVSVNRDNIAYPPLCAKYAALRFMDANNYQQLCYENHFDLAFAASILDDFEPRDF